MITNLVLSKESTLWLDRVRTAIRAQSGAAISRSALIRAIVGGLEDVLMDFSLCRREEDVRQLLGFYLKVYRQRAIEAEAIQNRSVLYAKKP